MLLTDLTLVLHVVDGAVGRAGPQRNSQAAAECVRVRIEMGLSVRQLVGLCLPSVIDEERSSSYEACR